MSICYSATLPIEGQAFQQYFSGSLQQHYSLVALMQKDNDSSDEFKESSPGSAYILWKAFIHACEFLELTDMEIKMIVSDSQVESKLKTQQSIDPISDLGEKALRIIKISERLNALTGCDRLWIDKFLRTHNKVIGDVPIKKLSSVQGLESVEIFLNQFS